MSFVAILNKYRRNNHMATKKIRLTDVEAEADVPAEASVPTQLDSAFWQKYAEAIDWKLWEILKLLRAQAEKDKD
jgi:hypothetical protein